MGEEKHFKSQAIDTESFHLKLKKLKQIAKRNNSMHIVHVSNMEILAPKDTNEEKAFGDKLEDFTSPSGKPPLNLKNSKTMTYLQKSKEDGKTIKGIVKSAMTGVIAAISRTEIDFVQGFDPNKTLDKMLLTKTAMQEMSKTAEISQ
jgi:hypothetical protein